MSDRIESIDLEGAVRNWWRALSGLAPNKERNRAALAELRRSADPLDVAFVPAFGDLRRALHAGTDWQIVRAAMIAYVLAHVREDDLRPVARALGPQKGDEGSIMSEARFRRLLQSRESDDLIRRLVRAVKMLKGKANVADLALSIWHWNDRTRRNWAFQYLNADPPNTDRDAA